MSYTPKNLYKIKNTANWKEPIIEPVFTENNDYLCFSLFRDMFDDKYKYQYLPKVKDDEGESNIIFSPFELEKLFKDTGCNYGIEIDFACVYMILGSW